MQPEWGAVLLKHDGDERHMARGILIAPLEGCGC
jgi:hypothetical protein